MATELEQLAVLESAGIASDAQKERLKALRANGAVPVAAPTASSPGAAPGADTIEVDADQFDKGWSGGANRPPPAAGIYPGVCVSIERASFKANTCIVQMASSDANLAWRGGLFCDSLVAPDGRAGKLRDALDALGVSYRREGRYLRLSLAEAKGKRADCEWAPDKEGVLRLNAIYEANSIKRMA